MTTVAQLVSRARMEIGDKARRFSDNLTADGVSKHFVFSHKPVSGDTTVTVLVNGSAVSLVAGVGYVIDYDNGAVNFVSPPAAGAIVNVDGGAYRYFTDDDWNTFVNTSLSQHLHGRVGTTLATLPTVEEYPVTLLAVTEALYALLNDASFDIDIHTPEGISIPRHQRFEQLNEMLTTRLMQYNMLSMALNVGLYRLENFDLRRVSRTTGRYVPIYLDREVENTAPPVRVFVPIDLMGSSPSPDTVPDQEITMVQGLTYTNTISTGRDLTGYDVRVTLRRYRASAAFQYFDVKVTDRVVGTVQFSMDAARTYTLGGGPYWWDLRIFKSGQVDSLVEGPVLVEERPRA